MAHSFQVNSAIQGKTRWRGGLPVLLLFFLVNLCCAAEPASSAKPKPAVLRISGYGFLGNRVLKRMLRTVELAGSKPEYFGTAFVEDAALMLTSRVKRDGYLNPVTTIRLRLVDGTQLQVRADELLEKPLPAHLRIKR